MTGAVADRLASTHPVRIGEYTEELVAAVKAFNRRLAAGGVPYAFPEEPTCRQLPRSSGRSIFKEYRLAVDGGGDVRGGYMIKFQDFHVRNTRIRAGFYHLPLSEGLIDRRYGALGVQLLADALRRQPELFVLGIGAESEALARMVRSARWPLQAVPFFFKILNGFRFARQIRSLRRTRTGRLLLDVAAFSGIASLASHGTRWWTFAPPPRETTSRTVDAFGCWADRTWERARDSYSMIAVRDVASLALLYPPMSRVLRLQVQRSGEPIGWAVLLDTWMQGNRHFGDLHVGTIVDVLAEPDLEFPVVAHAVAALEAAGADLIVSNQSARCWQQALRRAGFLRGPSGFLFGMSRPLARRLEPLASTLPFVHMTRGDGDGPINL